LSLSPGLLRKVVYAGANSPSFACASLMLRHLADQDIDPKTVLRACRRVGDERVRERDRQVESFQQTPLIYKDGSPVDPADLAVVMVDGGRLQILPEEEEESALPKEGRPAPQAAPHGCAAEPAPAEPAPAEPAPGPGVGPSAVALVEADEADEADEDQERKERFWREDKVGALLTMKSETHGQDPCPELPEVFTEPLVVLKLAREVGRAKAAQPGEVFASAGSAEKQKEEQEREEKEQEHKGRLRRPGAPEVQTRRVVATRQNNKAFGPMPAAAAWSIGLMAAGRRAFVADGSEANWRVQRRHFARFTAITDFIHVLSYVFAAAMAGRSFEEGWPVYQAWIDLVWKGKVEEVIKALRARTGELAQGGAEREAVQKSLTYLENQKGRMKYDEYRRDGLPIMSSIIESTVKQIGRRVKGSEKFWTEEGAEALLQLRADYLSDDEPMEHFWTRRAERMTGQRPRRKTA
jgi:hypothetical protein